MSLPVVLAEDAERDIETAFRWYATRGSLALAARFLAVVDTALARIEQFPGLHPEVAPGIRRSLTAPFPYLLLYEVAEREVVVHRCIHAHRDPIRWR